MKATKNKYTKEQFVREFLWRQARAKAEKSLNKEKNKVEVLDSSLSKCTKSVTDIKEKYTKKIDLTDVKEIFETKTIVEEPKKVIDINPLEKSTNSLSNNKTEKSIEDVKLAEEEMKETFNKGKNIVFEIKIVYTSANLCFNGLNLLEEKLQDGNLQVGFDVNVGTFIGDTIKKIVRKKKEKVELEELCSQLSFE